MIETAFHNNRDTGTEHLKLHFHSDYEMIYVSNGWMEIQVSGRIYHVEAPSVVFLNHLETHQILAVSSNYERYILTVSPDELHDIPPLLLSILRNRPAGFSHQLFLNEKYLTADSLFSQLHRSCMVYDEFTNLHENSLIRLLLIELYRISPHSFPASVQPCPEAIIKAQQYIDEHFRDNLNVDDIAAAFYMSGSYFRHQFHTLIGMSPKQYIMLNRLVYARSLLTFTAESIEEISEHCGFSDTNNFIRRFRLQYGITPGKYRQHGL